MIQLLRIYLYRHKRSFLILTFLVALLLLLPALRLLLSLLFYRRLLLAPARARREAAAEERDYSRILRDMQAINGIELPRGLRAAGDCSPAAAGACGCVSAKSASARRCSRRSGLHASSLARHVVGVECSASCFAQASPFESQPLSAQLSAYEELS